MSDKRAEEWRRFQAESRRAKWLDLARGGSAWFGFWSLVWGSLLLDRPDSAYAGVMLAIHVVITLLLVGVVVYSLRRLRVRGAGLEALSRNGPEASVGQKKKAEE